MFHSSSMMYHVGIYIACCLNLLKYLPKCAYRHYLCIMHAQWLQGPSGKWVDVMKRKRAIHENIINLVHEQHSKSNTEKVCSYNSNSDLNKLSVFLFCFFFPLCLPSLFCLLIGIKSIQLVLFQNNIFHVFGSWGHIFVCTLQEEIQSQITSSTEKGKKGFGPYLY